MPGADRKSIQNPERRRFLVRVPGALAAACPFVSGAWHPSTAQSADDANPARRHALSLIGEAQYPAGFAAFDWVNSTAPKGGKVRMRSIGTFDTLNPFTGKGSAAQAVSLIYDTLFLHSLDEPSTDYGLIAEWLSHPADYSSVKFGLRPQARFHDGAPITPEDVVFSLDALKAAGPQYAIYYKNVSRAQKTGPHEVEFIFDSKGNRELPQIVADLPILPRHFWHGKTDAGAPRDLNRATMEVPLGSGAYRILSLDPGRRITYTRVNDWWARDLPVVRGQWNFDELTFIYYRDRLPAFEAFKSGETDFWAESSAKAWATGYEIDAVRLGHMKKLALPTRNLQSMQGFAFNLRRKQFRDIRVRRAFNLAFNFEWANKNLFFDQYERTSSYFDNSELKASGLPQAEELGILETVRQGVPAEVFTQPYANPVHATSDDFRRHMSEASKLLAKAGWAMKGGVLTNPEGEKLTAEFLLVQPDFERLVLAYKAELEKLGLKIEVRVVDSALYTRRIETFDFDIVIARFPQSLSPGNEQREFWGSLAADKQGSRNVIGIKDPAIDVLIERLIFNRDREDLVHVTRALDRVLLWNSFLVPHFHSPVDRVAYWDKFARPEPGPRHAAALGAFLRVWWFDDAAARKLAATRGS